MIQSRIAYSGCLISRVGCWGLSPSPPPRFPIWFSPGLRCSAWAGAQFPFQKKVGVSMGGPCSVVEFDYIGAVALPEGVIFEVRFPIRRSTSAPKRMCLKRKAPRAFWQPVAPLWLHRACTPIARKRSSQL